MWIIRTRVCAINYGKLTWFKCINSNDSSLYFTHLSENVFLFDNTAQSKILRHPTKTLPGPVYNNGNEEKKRKTFSQMSVSFRRKLDGVEDRKPRVNLQTCKQMVESAKDLIPVFFFLTIVLYCHGADGKHHEQKHTWYLISLRFATWSCTASSFRLSLVLGWCHWL